MLEFVPSFSALPWTLYSFAAASKEKETSDKSDIQETWVLSLSQNSAWS